MRRQIDSFKKNGFTIIELLIVVLIIGLSYSLVISKIPQQKEKVKGLLTLREDLLNLKEKNYADFLDLVCYEENCNKCVIYLDGSKTPEDLELNLFTQKPKTYIFDDNGYLNEKQFGDNTCFRYGISSNDSGSSLFVEYNKEYYILYPTIKKTEKYTDYDQALKSYDPKEYVPTENSMFYSD